MAGNLHPATTAPYGVQNDYGDYGAQTSTSFVHYERVCPPRRQYVIHSVARTVIDRKPSKSPPTVDASDHSAATQPIKQHDDDDDVDVDASFIRQPFSSWSFARGRRSLVLLVPLRRHPAGGEQLVGRVAEQTLQVAHEAVHVALAGRLVDDVLVVVVAQTARQLLVVHLRLVLADAPAARHLVRVGQLELPIIARPRDEVLAVLVRQLLEQELPQLDRAAPCERENT